MPTDNRTRAAGGKHQKRRAKTPINTIKVTLWLPIRSEESDAREESLARKTIEKARLKQYGMKKLKGDEYDLTVSYQDEADIDEQIYTLFEAVKIEAERRKCSVQTESARQVCARRLNDKPIT